MSEITQFDFSSKESGDVSPTRDDNTTFEIYKGALTFNVISRYDPAISQLLHISPYCVVYEYVEEDGSWSKAGYQGPLALYSRTGAWDAHGLGFDKSSFQLQQSEGVGKSESSDNGVQSSESCLSVPEDKKVKVEEVASNDHLYKYGIIVLNRLQPENFSIGILGDKHIQANDIKEDKGMFVEVMEEIVIVRDFDGKVWGLWLYDVNDREYVSKLLTYCLEN